MRRIGAERREEQQNEYIVKDWMDEKIGGEQ